MPLSETVAPSGEALYREDPGFPTIPAAASRIATGRSIMAAAGAGAQAHRDHHGQSVRAASEDPQSRQSRHRRRSRDRPIGKDLQTNERARHRYRAIERWLFDLAIKGDFDGFDVVSDTSYSRRRFASTVDYSPVLGPLITQFFGVPNAGAGLVSDIGAKKFTQELRATSNSTGLIGWQIGAFYTRESAAIYQTTTSVDA